MRARDGGGRPEVRGRLLGGGGHGRLLGGQRLRAGRGEGLDGLLGGGLRHGVGVGLRLRVDRGLGQRRSGQRLGGGLGGAGLLRILDDEGVRLGRALCLDGGRDRYGFLGGGLHKGLRHGGPGRGLLGSGLLGSGLLGSGLLGRGLLRYGDGGVLGRCGGLGGLYRRRLGHRYGDGFGHRLPGRGLRLGELRHPGGGAGRRILRLGGVLGGDHGRLGLLGVGDLGRGLGRGLAGTGRPGFGHDDGFGGHRSLRRVGGLLARALLGGVHRLNRLRSGVRLLDGDRLLDGIGVLSRICRLSGIGLLTGIGLLDGHDRLGRHVRRHALDVRLRCVRLLGAGTRLGRTRLLDRHGRLGVSGRVGGLPGLGDGRRDAFFRRDRGTLDRLPVRRGLGGGVLGALLRGSRGHTVVTVGGLHPVVAVHDLGRCLSGGLGGETGDGRLRGAGLLGLLGGVGHRDGGRVNRFGSRRLRAGLYRGVGGRARVGRGVGGGRGTPRGRALRGHVAQGLRLEVLGTGGLRSGLPYRRSGGSAVGEGADRTRGGVGDRRAEVQRAARLLLGGRRVVRRRENGRRHRGRRGRAGQAHTAEVDRTAVPARRLVRARLVDGLDHRLRSGWRHFVAPRALGTRQQQVFVLGRRLGQVGVRTVRGNARLFHHACALRLPLARDLAGVRHAYPSPIG
uniref:hypothetical protein n=1 Tax=Streptomyces albidocamelliae TaxID=2981135 RepID=UPI00384EF5EF